VGNLTDISRILYRGRKACFPYHKSWNPVCHICRFKLCGLERPSKVCVKR